MDAGEEAARKQIAIGAERFVSAARSPLQARCVQLARMGCVVFHYDMIGYADSVQLSRDLAHGFRTQRPEMIGTESWGLFSPQAESLAQSVMGLQTWNSIRALDFGLSLPEVDPSRVAVTGASGGGTQSFILAAIEPRLTGAFPAVMVSTAMQGGCTCENACGLRIGTGNVEFAALNAPRPLGLTSANDWTVEMATKGFPELKALYRLLGAEDRVELHRAEHFGHNYNHVSRTAMYGWMNRLFRLGLPEPVLESDFHFLNPAELTVWDDAHPAPKGGPDFERRLLRRWRDLLWTCDPQPPFWLTPPVFRHVFGKGLEIVVGRTLAEAGEVAWEPRATREPAGEGWRIQAGLLRNRTYDEALPALSFEPVGSRPRATVVWVDGRGKAGLLGPDGESPADGVRRLLAAGLRVVTADLFELGEFRPDGRPLRQTRRVDNPREAAAYTLGYNHSLCAQRAHDVLTLIQWARQSGDPVWLLAVEGGSPWAAAAMAVAPGALEGAAMDTRGFRFFAVSDIRSPDLLPGAARYGDLPGMLAVGLPRWLALAGEDGVSPWLAKVAAWREAAIEGVEAPPAAATDRLLARLIERVRP
ncbi:MAG: acetylxylan esterase [Verrucomicrobia bacterium]|nr:MAG: acetylxylan esterase [Verrucomicrobiota bacterium]